MAGSHFNIEQPEPGIVTLTIDRPDRNNAFDLSMVGEMNQAWDVIEADPAARVVIICSALPKVFVAGGDIAAMRELDLAAGVRFVYAGQKLMSRLERSEQVVIAAVGGFALGGGTELALACDIRVASQRAVFGQPEVTLGLIPGWGGTQRLARMVGEGRAKEWVFTGRRVGAEEAYASGLVNRLCEPDTLDNAAMDLAGEILANAPMAVKRAKRAITDGLRVSLDQGLVIEAEAWLANLASPDRREGLSAFLEKRKPKFSHEA